MPVVENSGFTTETAVATIADGADVAQGATTDAAITTNAAGTLSGKLRGIVALLAGVLQVGGNAASGAADTGNPVKAGGRYNATDISLLDGQRADLQLGIAGAIAITGQASSGGDALSGGTTLIPARTTTTSRALGVGVYYVSGTSLDRARTPAIFKTAVATASGDTAVWTPTTGKKFRLMGYVIYVTANAAQAAGGNFEIILRDGTAAIGLGFSVFVPGAALTTFAVGDDSGVVELGNGFLSAAANNVLNVNLGAALTAGEVRVTAFGTEE